MPSAIGQVHAAVKRAACPLLEESLSLAPRSDRARQDAGVRTPHPSVNRLSTRHVSVCISGHRLILQHRTSSLRSNRSHRAIPDGGERPTPLMNPSLSTTSRT